MLFKKKKTSAKVVDNKDYLFNNIAKAKVLTSMTEDSVLVERLTKALEALRYSSPSANEEVVKLDDKIEKSLDDLKIMLATSRPVEKTLAEIADLDIVIARRKSLTEL